MREFLEKYYNADEASSEEKTVKLAIRALLEVVQSGGKNLEIAVMRKDQKMQVLKDSKCCAIIFLIDRSIYVKLMYIFGFRCWMSTLLTNMLRKWRKKRKRKQRRKNRKSSSHHYLIICISKFYIL